MARSPDAIVVGAGAVGCAVAWYLAREGLSVRVLERDDVAAGASGAAAGMLVPYSECDADGPLLRWGARSLAMFAPLCAELRERSGVDPELEASGSLQVARSEAEAHALREKLRTLPGGDLEWLDPADARRAEPQLAPDVHGALFAPRESHVRSPLLARAFAGAAAGLGARIEIGVTVLGLRRAGDRVTGVDTATGAREAGLVVLCAGAWTPEVTDWSVPIEPVRGQILSLENTQPPLRPILIGSACYVVPKRDGSVVVGATEERVGFDRRVTAAGMAQLLDAAPRLVPALAGASFRHGWAGLRPTTPDGLPVLGWLPGCERLLMAAGHHRNGVLLSPVTGRLVADLALGKAPPEDAAALRPDRFAGAAVR